MNKILNPNSLYLIEIINLESL